MPEPEAIKRAQVKLLSSMLLETDAVLSAEESRAVISDMGRMESIIAFVEQVVMREVAAQGSARNAAGSAQTNEQPQ